MNNEVECIVVYENGETLLWNFPCAPNVGDRILIQKINECECELEIVGKRYELGSEIFGDFIGIELHVKEVDKQTQKPESRFYMNAHFRQYLQLSSELSALIFQGKANSCEAGNIRDEMSTTESSLTDEEKRVAKTLAEYLNTGEVFR